MRHFLALRVFKSEEKCLIGSDSVAREAKATCLHQAAAVRSPAEPRSFISTSTDGPTQLCVFQAQPTSMHSTVPMVYTLKCSARNGFEDLNPPEALGTSLQSPVRRRKLPAVADGKRKSKS